jgi:hypothetical protein
MGRRVTASLASAFLSVLLLAIPGVSTLNAVGPATLKPVPLPKPAGQGTKEPIWTFELAQGEKTGFGFAAVKEGPIVAEIDWTGKPMSIALIGPGGKFVLPPRVERGPSARVAYTITASDVRSGSLWALILADPETPGSQPAVGRKVVIVSRGKARVQAPRGGSPERVKVEMEELKKRNASGMETATRDRIRMAANESRLRIKKIEDNRNAEIELSKSQLIARMKAEAPKTRPGSGSNPTGTQGGGPTIGQNDPNAISVPGVVIPPGWAPAKLQISSLNQYEGEPGTPIWIKGSGFAEQRYRETRQPEVYIIQPDIKFVDGRPVTHEARPVGGGEMPPQWVKAKIETWDDTQILVTVPEFSGFYDPFRSKVRVKTGWGQESNEKEFTIKPAMEYKEVAHKFFMKLGAADTGGCGPNQDHMYPLGVKCEHKAEPPPDVYDYLLSMMTTGNPVVAIVPSLLGEGGTNEFFKGFPMVYNWVVDYVDLIPLADGVMAGAYLTTDPNGSNWPHTVVRWWHVPMTDVRFILFMTIRGPRGTPDTITVLGNPL